MNGKRGMSEVERKGREKTNKYGKKGKVLEVQS